MISDRMVNELHAIITQLGGESVLRRKMRSDQDLQNAIREGFPPAVIERVMQSSGLTLKELAQCLDISPRSLQRRRLNGKLASHESDRLYRMARVVALAKHYLGDDAIAGRWLKRPNRALGGKIPFDSLDTEAGARSVENVLGRIAYGGIS